MSRLHVTMPTSEHLSQAYKRSLVRRIAGVGSLLFAEYLIFSILFDFGSLQDKSSWIQIFGYLGQVSMFGIFLATSIYILFLSGFRFEREGNTAKTLRLANPGEVWKFLSLHVVIYFCLLWMTPKIFSSSSWLTLWIFCALIFGITAVFSVFQPQALPLLARPLVKSLLIGSIVAIAAWAAGYLMVILSGASLGDWTFIIVGKLLSPFSGGLIYDLENNLIGTSQFAVRITQTCTGYQGIGLMSVFVVVYLIVARKRLRFPAAMVLLPVSLVAVWLANSVRIALIIAIGSWGWQDVALGTFHSNVGWLFFCALSLAVVAVSRRWRFLGKSSDDSYRDEHWNPTAAYLLPLLVGTGIAMIANSFSVSEVNLFYPVSIVASTTALWLYRHSIFPLEMSNSKFPWVVGLGVGILWIILDGLMPTGAGNEFPKDLERLSITSLSVWLTFRVLGSCVVIPFVEEIAFRGYLLRVLINRDFTDVSYRTFTWLSFLISSILFGILHDRWLAGIISGMLFAVVLYHRGKLLDAVIAHALSNSVIAFYVLIFGRWSLWI